MILVGECNRCGLCCVRDGLRCEHLSIQGNIGEPLATCCLAHAARYNLMPIKISDGVRTEQAFCGKDSIQEVYSILPYIGQGCSLARE